MLFIEGPGHLIAGPHFQKNPFRPVRQKLHELIGQTLTLIGFFHSKLGDFQLSSQVLDGQKTNQGLSLIEIEILCVDLLQIRLNLLQIPGRKPIDIGQKVQ